jgi:hypothetical protein
VSHRDPRAALAQFVSFTFSSPCRVISCSSQAFPAAMEKVIENHGKLWYRIMILDFETYAIENESK